jgi:hypothetical protein
LEQRYGDVLGNIRKKLKIGYDLFFTGNDNKKKNQRIKMISGLLKPIQINADKISKISSRLCV